MEQVNLNEVNYEIVVGEAVVKGTAYGLVEGANEKLSFWGGYDTETGKIVDKRHPLAGKTIKNKILAIPSGRGSSTGSPVLLDSLVSGNAPAGLLMSKADEIISLGVILYEEFYGPNIPIVVLEELDFLKAIKAKKARINENGTVLLFYS